MLEKYHSKVSQITSGKFYGIDLGTTYTIISVVDMEEAGINQGRLPVKRIVFEQLSPLEMVASERSDIVASILGVRNDGRMFVGNRLYQLKGHPDFIKDQNLFYHWKLDLGVSAKPLYKNAVLQDVDDASKVAGKILNYCRLQLMEKTTSWSKVIITVPASFQANQRNDVIEAAKYAQIKQDTCGLIDEPNAAFIGFLNQLNTEEKNQLFQKNKTNLMVIDFGGGTCDLSILVLNTPHKLELKISNLAISRYNDLGGQDIDMMIAGEFLLPVFQEVFQEEEFAPHEIEMIILPQLAVIAERLKIDLSRIISAKYQQFETIPEKAGLVSRLENQKITIRDRQYSVAEYVLHFNDFRKVMSYLFTENEYQLQIADKIIRSVPNVVEDILTKANKSFADIDFILFAGGSVQNLMFVQETMKLFASSKSLLPVRPDTLVSEGAAIYSFYRHALGIELLRPICSDTLGISVKGEPFFPLINAGTPLPVTISLPSFSLQHEHQKQLSIPFCIKDESNVVSVIEIAVDDDISSGDIISIDAILTENKLLKVEVSCAGKSIGSCELINPFQLANLSEEERALFDTIRQLEQARHNEDRGLEKSLMRSLVYEYYDLGNYTRAAALGTEWLEKFSPADVGMNNLMYCAFDNLGNRRNAEKYLEQGLKYGPENESLIHNKSLLIEKKEGIGEAIKYLQKQSERVKQNHTVRFRLALLQYHANDRKPAAAIAEEYNQGGFDFIHSSFQKSLLHRIVKLFEFNIRAEPLDSQTTTKKFNNEDKLLKIARYLPE